MIIIIIIIITITTTTSIQAVGSPADPFSPNSFSYFFKILHLFLRILTKC